MDMKSILNKALESEEEQYKRYTQCASFLQIANAKRLFYAFADNEELHSQVLKKMLVKLLLKTEKDGVCGICGHDILYDLSICTECAKKELQSKILKKME